MRQLSIQHRADDVERGAVALDHCALQLRLDRRPHLDEVHGLLRPYVRDGDPDLVWRGRRRTAEGGVVVGVPRCLIRESGAGHPCAPGGEDGPHTPIALGPFEALGDSRREVPHGAPTGASPR